MSVSVPVPVPVPVRSGSDGPKGRPRWGVNANQFVGPMLGSHEPGKGQDILCVPRCESQLFATLPVDVRWLKSR